MACAVHRREAVTSHDKLFKRLMKEDGVAEALMRERLPPAVSNRIAGPPELLSESFVEASMKGLYADAVLRVPLKGDESALVYCIVEHKRVEDRHVLLQLLRYLTAVYSHLATTQPGRLPLVLPLIIYNGESDWVGPLHFGSLIEHRASLRRHALDFEVLFLDVARTPLEQLSLNPALKAGLLAMRATASSLEQLEQLLPDLLDQLERAFEHSTTQLFINYLLTAAPRGARSVVEQAVLSQETRPMMTIAESYARDGYRKGLRAGEAEAARKMLRMILRKRFGSLSIVHLKKVRRASAKRVLDWSLRALDAKTIDAVFAK